MEPAVLLRVRRDPRRAPSVGVRAGEGWARVSVALGGAPPGPGGLARPLAAALARALPALAALGWEGGGGPPELEGPLPPGLDPARVREEWAAALADRREGRPEGRHERAGPAPEGWARAPGPPAADPLGGPDFALAFDPAFEPAAPLFPRAAPAPAPAWAAPAREPPGLLFPQSASAPARVAPAPARPLSARAGPGPAPTAKVLRLTEAVAARVREGVDPPDFGSKKPSVVRKAWNYIRSVGDARDLTEAELDEVRVALARMFPA